MEANEAPEKIYIPTILAANVVRYKEEGSIEYVRKDAFVKKACEGIKHLLSGYIIRNFHFGDSYNIDTLLEDFRKYLEESKV